MELADELFGKLERRITNALSELDCLKRMAAPASELPARLWHYTDADGLLGIIRLNSLRATDVFFFNDSSEIGYAVELVNSVLLGVRKAFGYPKAQPIDRVADRFAKLANRLVFPYRVYATCFCEEGDLLSQWRGYGARGGGYALGFESLALFQKVQSADVAVYRVVYHREEQRRLITALLASACETYVQFLDEERPKGQVSKALATRTGERIFASLSRYLPAMKAGVFSEEREWRVLQYCDTKNQRDFVVRHGVAVPYIELKHDSLHLPISVIQRGPTLEPALATRSLVDLLDAYGYTGVELKGSDIPLRV
jgi:hypothetical protein